MVLRRLTDSPFGRVLTTIRENPERAASIGVNVRAYELAAFAIAGGFAGLSGALFGIFNRGVFADFVFWSKSADVMIMTILGGMQHFCFSSKCRSSAVRTGLAAGGNRIRTLGAPAG